MQVKAKTDCFVDGSYRHAGEQFEYSGPKNENLEPLKNAGPRAEAEAKDGE